MTKILTYKYNNFSIEIFVSERGCFTAFCNELNINSSGEHFLLESCKKSIEVNIDAWLTVSIDTINALADEITNKLSSYGYEEFYLSPVVLENILKQTNLKNLK